MSEQEQTSSDKREPVSMLDLYIYEYYPDTTPEERAQIKASIRAAMVEAVIKERGKCKSE